MDARTSTPTPRRTGQPPTAPRPPAARTALSSGKPLSNSQKAAISQTARQAFDVQDRAGLVEGFGCDAKRFESWRRAEQLAATGIASLRESGNNHYRPLIAHFLTLAGRDDVAFAQYCRSGRVKDHGAAADTHENRETRRTNIMQALVVHGRRCDALHPDFCAATAATVAAKGGLITVGYVIAIAKAKCKGRSLDRLTTAELDQILYTTVNRISAREGRGATARRNKSQRKS